MARPDRLRAKLKTANAIPGQVRAAMMADPAAVRPGGADVLQRFFAEVRARRAPFDCPPRACFDAAARSEATLATLLRTLERFAPEICLAEGRAARQAWYAKRGGAGRTESLAKPPAPSGPPAIWPELWRPAYPRLIAAGRRPATGRRYVSSLNRCAAELAGCGLAPEVDRFRALVLGEAFAGRGLSPRTTRNYLDAFLRLSDALGCDATTREGIADAVEAWRARAAAAPKQRQLRIESWQEAGQSLEGTIDLATGLLADLDAAPGTWRAARARRRLAATVLLVALNTVPRTGDMAAWRIGRELRREADGLWSLAYTAQKTGHLVSVSRLWPETSAALDRLLLAGRPERMLSERYAALAGCNWMRHTPEAPPPRYPSQLIRELTGLSSHPLRTLAADMLRVIDPATGADRAGALLGHGDARSIAAYRAAAEGRAAAATWAACRSGLRER